MSENLEIVSTERGKKLLEKWGAVLEYTSLSDEEHFKKYGKTKEELSNTRLSTAILLEGQESWLSEEAKEKLLKRQKEK